MTRSPERALTDHRCSWEPARLKAINSSPQPKKYRSAVPCGRCGPNPVRYVGSLNCVECTRRGRLGSETRKRNKLMQWNYS